MAEAMAGMREALGCGIRLHAGRICRIFAIFVPTAEWAHIFANVVAALLVCVDF